MVWRELGNRVGLTGHVLRWKLPAVDGVCPGHHAVHHGIDHPSAPDGRVALFGEAVKRRRTRAPQDHDLYTLPYGRALRSSVAGHGDGVYEESGNCDASRRWFRPDDHDHADGRYGVHHVARRTNYRARNRKWNVADHLRRYR